MVIVGCGRAGAGLAAGLAQAGEVVAVVDEELGVVTVSSTDWAMGKIRDHLEYHTLKEETSLGRGEVSLLRLELPRHLVDRTVADVEADGLGWSASPAGAGRSCPGPVPSWPRATWSAWPSGPADGPGSTPCWPRRPAASRPARGAGGRAGRDHGPAGPGGRRSYGRGRRRRRPPGAGRRGPRPHHLQAEPDLRRLLGGRPGGSHIPAG